MHLYHLDGVIVSMPAVSVGDNDGSKDKLRVETGCIRVKIFGIKW